MREKWDNLIQGVKDEAEGVDQVISLWQQGYAAAGKRIFCAAGCSSCCTLYVQSTLIEALIVAEQLGAEQFIKLEAYVVRQREVLAGETDFLALLRKQRTLIGPCPFLDNNGCCTIYAQRPLACRALLSTKASGWCEVDFSTLDPLDKRLYLESLDRSIVSFPVHYVASTQRAAQDGEERILQQMRHLLGIAISGNFPLLVYLASTRDMARQRHAGLESWQKEWQENTFFHPLLLQIEPAD